VLLTFKVGSRGDSTHVQWQVDDYYSAKLLTGIEYLTTPPLQDA
jgi:hypothetical protein